LNSNEGQAATATGLLYSAGLSRIVTFSMAPLSTARSAASATSVAA
jgi:hypothetical protein